MAYAEEAADPYEVACLVHEFFKEMRPDGDDEFTITWSDTCSKMRLDEFGGGTCVATKNGVGVCGYDSQLEYARTHLKSVDDHEDSQ